jgi:Holliday junction resolvase RusA-like endonuclease
MDIDGVTLDLPGTADQPRKGRRKASQKTAEGIAHKRKMRRPTVATLDISGIRDGVVVLAINDVLTKNDRHVRTSRGTCESVLSKAYKLAVARAAHARGFTEAIKVPAISSGPNKRKASTVYGVKTIQSGLWSLEVLSVWPTERHLDPAVCGLANGDSDSPLAMVRDAMQRAGIIDDDMRIVRNATDAIYEKDERRTVARLVRLDGNMKDARRVAIASLLAAEKQATSSATC